MAKFQYFLAVALNLIILTTIDANKITFNATKLTKVGAATKLKINDTITCQILDVKRNVTYEIGQGLEETYDTSSGSGFKNITIENDCLKFSIYKYDNTSFYWSKFRIINAIKNSSYYFVIATDGLKVYKVKTDTEEIEWKKYYDKENLLPMYKETPFWIQYKNDNILFGSVRHGTLIKLPITKKSKPHIMQIEGEYASSAIWKVNDCFNSSKIYNFDRFNTICWNSTHNENNDTGIQTEFTMMIYSQYHLNKVMENDLMNMKKWDNSTMIKEYLEEFLNDVKVNYLYSKKLHNKILKVYQLNKYEIKLKKIYLKDYIYENIRSNYYEIYKRIQLILSRFR